MGSGSIDAVNGPFRYVLWCCGSICHQLFTFIQIGPRHPVTHRDAVNSSLKQRLGNNNWQGPIFKEGIGCKYDGR